MSNWSLSNKRNFRKTTSFLGQRLAETKKINLQLLLLITKTIISCKIQNKHYKSNVSTY